MAELPTVAQLRYFLASVEHGSFAAAADAMYIAAPSLSEQIKRLENRLGVVLFTRTNRALQLTDAGRVLVPQAERILGVSANSSTLRATSARSPGAPCHSARSAARTCTCCPR